MNVRACEEREREAWLRMRMALWPEPPALHLMDIDAFLAGESTTLDAVFLCHAPDAGPVGFIEIRLRDYAEGSNESAVPYVEGWYVEEAWRGRGVGAALMARAERWASEQGFRELASDTELHNERSISAHRALGFAEVERTVHFLKAL